MNDIPTAPKFLIRSLLREPLVHFFLIGGLLFGIDQTRERPELAITQTQATRPGPVDAGSKRIEVNAGVRQRLRESFERLHGAPPSAAEFQIRLDTWIREEILYREALARKLDQDDERVRQLVASKMAFVLDAQTLIAEPSDAELRAFYEKNAGRWATDTAFDFIHVYVNGSDDTANARAQTLLAQLRKGDSPAQMGDPFSGGRRYRRRTVADLTEAFGDAFARGVASQKPGEWTWQPSRFGFHLVRLEGETPATRPAFEAVRHDAALQWRTQQKEAALEKRIRELRSGWEVVEVP